MHTGQRNNTINFGQVCETCSDFLMRTPDRVQIGDSGLGPKSSRCRLGTVTEHVKMTDAMLMQRGGLKQLLVW